MIEDNPNVWKRKYQAHEIKHKVLYFETNNWGEKHPEEMGSFSVKDINKQAVAWIYTDEYNIYAGTTYEEFIAIIEEHGGKIYIEKENK